MVRSAIILSAGYGKRLAPITDIVPKPLIPVANKKIISRIIDNLRNCSITDFFFNTHHLTEKVEGYLASYSSINKVIIRENALRGTGGGIDNFRSQLSEETFLIHNCDVFLEEDLQSLIDDHFSGKKPLATLLVVDYPEINSVIVENGKISSFIHNKGNFTYSGVGVISSDIWKYFPSKETFSIIDVFKNALKADESINAFYSGSYWNDIGTPKRYWDVNEYFSHGIKQHIHPSAEISSTTLSGFNFVGNNAKLVNCCLNDCIVLPDTAIKNINYDRCIAYPGGFVKVKC